MVQLNPVPVFSAKKNTSTICQKFFTEISIQMVSAPTQTIVGQCESCHSLKKAQLLILSLGPSCSNAD